MIYAVLIAFGFAAGVATYNSLRASVERRTGCCAWCKRSLLPSIPAPGASHG